MSEGRDQRNVCEGARAIGAAAASGGTRSRGVENSIGAIEAAVAAAQRGRITLCCQWFVVIRHAGYTCCVNGALNGDNNSQMQLSHFVSGHFPRRVWQSLD